MKRKLVLHTEIRTQHGGAIHLKIYAVRIKDKGGKERNKWTFYDDNGHEPEPYSSYKKALVRYREMFRIVHGQGEYEDGIDDEHEETE